MKALDRELQRQRIAKALPFVDPGSTVLDIGCADGEFFAAARGKVADGVGVDLQQPDSWVGEPYELRVGPFPDVLHPGETFDAIVALAVVEHVPEDSLAIWAKAIPEHLKPGGRLVITTPSPRVDEILHALIRLRIIDGMEAHEHYGFDPASVPGIFGSDALVLEVRRRFQLGLNHLFVFRTPYTEVTDEG
jgi:2-polyprenyl-3-methyl-5-hydroxy-6-metoxy-1,4-benzoquinol methylase